MGAVSLITISLCLTQMAFVRKVVVKESVDGGEFL